MLLSELKAEVFKLPPSDRLALVTAIVESLHDSPVPTPERADAIQRMRGLLKTEKLAPTDQDVAILLENRRVDKYLLQAISPGTLTGLRGIAKRPEAASSDQELQAEYTDYLTQKYQ